MSAKIIQAVNKMISTPEKITDVEPVGPSGELLFKYDAKFVWGTMRRGDDIFLYFYPKALSTKQLSIMLSTIDAEPDFPMITYSTRDIGTREASDSFKDLHLLVNEKVYGVDKVLDAIIDDEIPF